MDIHSTEGTSTLSGKKSTDSDHGKLFPIMECARIVHPASKHSFVLVVLVSKEGGNEDEKIIAIHEETSHKIPSSCTSHTHALGGLTTRTEAFIVKDKQGTINSN